MRQHIIPRWYLDRFARDTTGGRILAAYEKATTACRDVPPTRFMTATDDHDAEIEAELGRLESPAAAAVQALDERVRALPPGLYRVAGERDEDRDATEAPIRDGGVIEDMHLFVADRQIRRLPSDERRALARFAALMYSRAPKIERAMRLVSDAYVRGIRTAVASYGKTIDIDHTVFLSAELERTRWLGLREADQIAGPLENATWWVLRSGPNEEFILGDSPVVVTLQLGHDDAWRRLLGDDGYVIAMPLGPELALLIANLLTVGVEAEEFVGALNRHSWKWAEDFTMGTDCEVLRTAARVFASAGWSDAAPASVDSPAAYWKGVGFVHRVLVENQPPSDLLRPSLERLRAEAFLEYPG